MYVDKQKHQDKKDKESPYVPEYDVAKIQTLANHEGFLELKKFMNVHNRAAVKKLLNKSTADMQDIGFHRGLVKSHERIVDIVVSGKTPGKNE